MGSSEKFCLRWNDFERNISGAFRELREDKDFFDVTLACDDDQIQAHKVILSACSPFFRSILRRNKHEHPLLYLKGVKYVDLVSVLNFMYHGEVNVAQEELNSFLAVAEDLKVKGLTQNSSESNSLPRSEPPTPRPRDPPERVDPTPPPKRARPPPPPPVPRPAPPTSSYRHQDDDIQEVVPVKSEPMTHHPDPLPSHTISPLTQHDQPYAAPVVSQVPQMQHEGVVADPSMEYGEEYGDYEGYEEGGMDGSYEGSMMDNSGLGGNDGNKVVGYDMDNLDGLKSAMIVETWEGSVRMFACSVCKKSSNRRQIISNHVETHIDGFVHICEVCCKTFRSKNSLQSHVSKHHK